MCRIFVLLGKYFSTNYRYLHRFSISACKHVQTCVARRNIEAKKNINHFYSIYLPPFCLHKSINLPQLASHAVASFSALHLLKHCKLYAAHPTALPAGPEAASAFLASHPQHFFGSSVFTSAFAHEQQSAFGGCGWQCGDFSHTNAQRGFWQSAGRWHFQSHNGSSHTLSHFGVGLVHSVWHCGSLHTVSHFGHAPFSQCLTGQRTSHCGLSHLIAHLLQPNSWHLVEHLGCSQIGSQTWLHTGESHFHWHLGWQSPFSPQSVVVVVVKEREKLVCWCFLGCMFGTT